MIAIVLINPKTPANVGGCIRAASIFGVDQVWWTGTRVHDGRGVSQTTGTGMSRKKWRLPREERMKAYDIAWGVDENALDRLVKIEGFTPVCVELVEGAELLPQFEHPEENTVYVFGPEDGAVPKGIRHFCHRFVQIPGAHCLNLAAAVNVTLYDRMAKAESLVLA
jgi:tRNA(Leu) C34 or U34 (ribose-2'-O)-methylase TrmL